MPSRYYLANGRDTLRLATTGHIEAAHDCQPWYFNSEEAALRHPMAEGLMVYCVPLAETIPGLPMGAIVAEEVYEGIGHHG